jgi:hypothetical protein
MATYEIERQYELLRNSVLTAFIQRPEAFHPAYAFAWYNRMAALGLAHRNEGAFDQGHDISSAKVGIVLGAVKQLETSGQWDDISEARLAKQIPQVTAKQLHKILDYLALKGYLGPETVRCFNADINTVALRTEFSPADVRFPGTD